MTLWDAWDEWERNGPPPPPLRRRRTDRWQYKLRFAAALVGSHSAVWAVTNWFAEIGRWMEANQRNH